MVKPQNTEPGWTVPKGEDMEMGVLPGLGGEGQVINLGWEPRGGGPHAALVSREHGYPPTQILQTTPGVS